MLNLLYLGRHIIRNKALYYRYLLEVTARQDRERWIPFVPEAVRTTAEWTTAKVRAVRELLDETGTAIRQRMPKVCSRELTELIFVHACHRIGGVFKANIAKRQTAAVHLKALAAEGLLEEIRTGRENLCIHPRLLALPTDRGCHAQRGGISTAPARLHTLIGTRTGFGARESQPSPRPGAETDRRAPEQGATTGAS